MDYPIIWAEEAKENYRIITLYLLDTFGFAVANRFTNTINDKLRILEKTVSYQWTIWIKYLVNRYGMTIFRITWLLRSATYRMPLLSMAMERASRKRAAVPVPSV